MPFVYILRCSDGTLYTGWAVDVARRVKAHNAGQGARYTRGRCPVTLVYVEAVPTRSAALKREHAVKQYPRAKKLALANGRKTIDRRARRKLSKGRTGARSRLNGGRGNSL